MNLRIASLVGSEKEVRGGKTKGKTEDSRRKQSSRSLKVNVLRRKPVRSEELRILNSSEFRFHFKILCKKKLTV